MKDWKDYWAEAMAEFEQGEVRFGAKYADDLKTFWPGRKEAMEAFYEAIAMRHADTVNRRLYPDHMQELDILLWMAWGKRAYEPQPVLPRDEQVDRFLSALQNPVHEPEIA